MLKKQEFVFPRLAVTLIREESGQAKIAITSEIVRLENKNLITEHIIELDIIQMRRLVNTLKDSPYIFSEQNK